MRISRKESVVGCLRIMHRALAENQLLSARLRHHVGVEARRVIDVQGEFIGATKDEDDLVHVPHQSWIVQTERAPAGSIPDPIFSQAQLLRRFVVSREVFTNGSGLVFTVARAVIFKGAQTFMLWRPDGLHVGQSGDVLISWTFDPKEKGDWEDEHFAVVDSSVWDSDYEIIRRKPLQEEL